MKGDPQRLAIVLWKGVVGGAEVLSVALADRMRQVGVQATTVFIEYPDPLAERLSDLGLMHQSLGLRRGREVLRHPGQYAAAVARAGPDGALLVTCGFMGGALRAGGYRGGIVAVEHGDLLEAEYRPRYQQPLNWMSRVMGAWADDVEVAVSDYVLDRLRRQPHTQALERIYNGIDPEQYWQDPAPVARGDDDECVVAFASRLVPGKGPDYLIKAVAQIASTRSVKLLIAGDGPERARLESLARSRGVAERVCFLGLKHDMPAFWRACDIAVVPSAEFIEACPLTPLEAMACGRPVIATRNGGLPELVLDGTTGMLIAAGDEGALAKALDIYAGDRDLRMSHGASGRARVVSRFHIDQCAQGYLDLFDELAKPLRSRIGG